MTYEQARSFVKNNPSSTFVGWDEGNERPHKFIHVEDNTWEVERLSTDQEISEAKEKCVHKLKQHIKICIERNQKLDIEVVELFNYLTLRPKVERKALIDMFGSGFLDLFYPMTWE